MSLSFTPWELESQRWHSPSYIQLDAMPCRDFGHYRPHVRVHQARDCRPVVAINFVLSFLKGPTLLGISSLSAMCIENLEGDYYIPGSIPDGAEGIWKEAQAWSKLKTVNSWKQCHVFYLDHTWFPSCATGSDWIIGGHVGKPCDVGLQPQSSQECQCEAKGWVGGWGPNSLNLQTECFQLLKSSLKTLNRNWLSVMHQQCKTSSPCPASWAGCSRRWRSNLEEILPFSRRSKRCGILGSLALEQHCGERAIENQKTTWHTDVIPQALEIQWNLNSAAQITYVGMGALLGQVTFFGWLVFLISKTLTLCCGI